MNFYKYQALGNDYLVIPPTVERVDQVSLSADQIIRICDRHYGIGSDGILLGPLPSTEADFGLRLFNPDGGEFEKSGNGLRIFARYLWDEGHVDNSPFTIMTPGGSVTAQIIDPQQRIQIDMGQVSFDSKQIGVVGPQREVINEAMALEHEMLRYCAVTIGNPHCVVLMNKVDAATARQLGPIIEHETRFPNRINVQFMQIIDRNNIRIEIWERGAGYTLASGSSSSAAAAVAHRLGLCDQAINVHCPGGIIEIAIGNDWTVRMTGPATKVCQGQIAAEAFG
ncbi:MAG: diaminopimelate epimerase [Caldilineaceae bacterium]|nr:diaminopimelate epimerase [Caldilineaceae bacterium]